MINVAMQYVIERLPDKEVLKKALCRSHDNMKNDLGLENESIVDLFFKALPEEYRAEGGGSKGLTPPEDIEQTVKAPKDSHTAPTS